MKTIKKFKLGEPIPDNAKFLYKDTEVIGYEPAEHSLLNDMPIYQALFYYEIPEEKEINLGNKGTK